LHAQLAAILALKTGTVVALKVSILAWLVIGAAGMRRLCRFHGVRPWVAWLAGVLLMTAHYTVDDWYIRGATAEMVAFMLFPWGLRYAYEVFERKWGATRLAVATVLIFFAHMITCYFFLLTAAAVMLGGWLRRRASGWSGLRSALGRCLRFGLLLVVLVGPYAAAVLYTSKFAASARSTCARKTPTSSPGGRTSPTRTSPGPVAASWTPG
jgi:hypothetical protein